ncbi:MAG: glycosyltransferase family 9 protein [Bacteroidetes bacterium]|nr:glycosyltransferase family 9 protein [Bacteroidota bacterium]
MSEQIVPDAMKIFAGTPIADHAHCSNSRSDSPVAPWAERKRTIRFRWLSSAMLKPRRNANEAIPPLETTAPATIALFQPGRLGDMILTTPLFHALKAQFPATHLTVIASEASASIPSSQNVVDRVIPVPGGLLRQIPFLASTLRATTFDIYIDIKDHRSTTSRLVAEIIHARRLIGHRTAIGSHPGGAELPAPAPPGHYVDSALAPMQLLAPGSRFNRRPMLDIPTAAYRAVDEQLDPGEHGMAAINISAGDPSRYWKPEKWRALIRELSRQFNVVVLAAPNDRGLADEICSTRRTARTVRTDSILEAAAVVDRARVVISPDTSIVHIASARNRPCVGLYPPGNENAARFAPLSDRHRVLMPAQEETLAAIPMEAVYEAALALTGTA